MILVIGGLGSGKRAYALELGYADGDISADVHGAQPVLADAQDLVRADGVDAQALADEVAASKRLVLFQEVGSGVVPLDAGEREWRDRAGGFSRELAKRADAVVRMVCGIPQVLKGELPGEVGEGVSAQPGVQRLQASSSFFTNRACKHFPCHTGIAEEDFNCLFCYCPMYALGPDCGGNFTYTSKGRKNCKDCALPHLRDEGVKLVQSRFEQIAALAAQKGE